MLCNSRLATTRKNDKKEEEQIAMLFAKTTKIMEQRVQDLEDSLNQIKKKSKTSSSLKASPSKVVSFRIPVDMVEEIESEAQTKEISENVLIKQLISNYFDWYKFESVMNMVPIPSQILTEFSVDNDNKKIEKLADTIIPILNNIILITSGNLNLETFLEFVKKYCKHSGQNFIHNSENYIHTIAIQHNCGKSFSLLLKHVFNHYFKTFQSDNEMTVQLNDQSVIFCAKID